MTYIAHPLNEAQEKAIKAFLEALEVPYESTADADETAHLLSTEANKKRLMESISEIEGGTKVNLDDIWK
ncbi:MAG: hypothetical protein JWP69_1795 [Flaviaesturariibacter sp.]|nr:hypothetical protein [Flaviaesturariibacter sp.]